MVARHSTSNKYFKYTSDKSNIPQISVNIPQINRNQPEINRNQRQINTNPPQINTNYYIHFPSEMVKSKNYENLEHLSKLFVKYALWLQRMLAKTFILSKLYGIEKANQYTKKFKLSLDLFIINVSGR